MVGGVSTSFMPPNSRTTVGRTFLVALILLGIFAFVQILATAWHYLPLLRARLTAASVEEPPAPPASPAAAPAQEPGVSPGASPPNPAYVARAAQFVAEADKNYRVGDFEASLRLLQQAVVILPTDPSIQFRLGQIFEALDDKAQAFSAYERSVAVPGLPKEIQRQAEQKMVLLAQVMGEVPEQVPLTSQGASLPAGSEAHAGEAMRDTVGLRPGSSLGIVEAHIQDGHPGIKNLRVAVKSRPNLKIDPTQMNVHVYFYEKEETGEIVAAEAKSSSQWISPPVDWKDGEPEILNMEYPTPDGGQPGNSAEFGALGRTYYGYIIGVYYKGELQDSRADPGPLEAKFPLPLTLERNSTR